MASDVNVYGSTLGSTLSLILRERLIVLWVLQYRRAYPVECDFHRITADSLPHVISDVSFRCLNVIIDHNQS